MRTPRFTVAVIAAAGFLTIWAADAVAQTRTPSQADYDACNREAQVRASSPSASPSGTPGSSTSTLGRGSSSTNGGGTSVSGGPATSGSGTMSSGTPGTTGSGAASSGTSSTTGSGTLSGGAGTTGSGSASDPALRGMAAAGHGDTAYQEAYRDCMTRRGF